MKNVTPKSFQCAFASACPSIFEVTPQDMRCSLSQCPAIFEQENGYLIIGKKVGTAPPELLGRIGADETVVWVPRGLVKPADEIARLHAENDDLRRALSDLYYAAYDDGTLSVDLGCRVALLIGKS